MNIVKIFFLVYISTLNAIAQTSNVTLEQSLSTLSVYENILISTNHNQEIPNVDKGIKEYNNTLLFKSLCEFKDASYWSGYWDLKKVYNLSHKAYKENQNDTFNGLIVSIISTTVSIIPQEYQWIMRLVGFPIIDEYDIQQLIENAKNADDDLIRFEAYSADLLLDAFILKNNPQEKLEIFSLKYSSLFEGKIIISWVNDKLKNYSNNIELLKTFTLDEIQRYGYYYYLLGTAEFYDGHYNQSKKSFHKYLLVTQGDYIKTSNYRLYLIAWLIENKSRNELLTLRNTIITDGEERLYLDKHAQSFALDYTYSNKELMHARILFDSKNYSASDSILSIMNTEEFSKKDKLEYNYRHARVKQALNDTTLAIKYYLNVIEYGGAKPKEYFTANSALNLGKLYEGLNDKQKASFYYKKAYSYPKHAYKNSIDSEAKRRLNSL